MKGYANSGSMVTAMIATDKNEPTYGQFEGTFQYRQKKTPYAVTQPKNLVTLVDNQYSGQADAWVILARFPVSGPWYLHVVRADMHCPNQLVAGAEVQSNMP